MDLNSAKFLRFQVVFWLLAYGALTISGLTQMGARVALVRNLYLLAAGFLVSLFLAFVYQRFIAGRVRHVLAPLLVLSYLGGLFATVSVNPITLGMLGVPLNTAGTGTLFSRALNFALVLALWSVIYFSLQGIPLIARGERGRLTSLVVDDGAAKRSIVVADIICLVAAGDYVEIVTAAKTYLKRGYLGDMENRLDGDDFMRIHRSTVVNLGSIEDVSILPKGQFEFTLKGGPTVTSSRGYRDSIQNWLDRRGG